MFFLVEQLRKFGVLRNELFVNVRVETAAGEIETDHYADQRREGVDDASGKFERRVNAVFCGWLGGVICR